MSYSRLYTMVRYKAIYYVVYCLSDSMFVCLSASSLTIVRCDQSVVSVFSFIFAITSTKQRARLKLEFYCLIF